jgi:uncharacterized protein
MIVAAATSLDQWLSDQGFDQANLEQPGSNGDTALLRAVQVEALEVVVALLQAGVNVNARNADRNNALWFACFRNRLDLIEILLAAQIDFDNQNENGATALMYAASTGKIEVLKALLAAGANPHLVTLDDFAAIDFAANAEVFRILQNVVR